MIKPRAKSRPGDPLTARELQVVDLVVAGLTNQEIARKLFLGESTVKSHLKRIFTKTGVARRAGLATSQHRIRTTPEIVVMLKELRKEREAAEPKLASADWFRRDGELMILNRLIQQLVVNYPTHGKAGQ